MTNLVFDGYSMWHLKSYPNSDVSNQVEVVRIGSKQE